MMLKPGVRLLVGSVIALALCEPTPLNAQGLPSEPFVVANGRVVISGDVSLTASCSHASGAALCTEDSGFFNYSDYSDSTIRMARIGLSTAVRLGRRFSVLGDVRSQNARMPHPYSLYLRFKPFDGRNIDIQAGRIPSTFGAFPRRAYSSDNPLIGFPLGYQYLTSLRADALPANTDDLIRMRGRGWLSSFPIGNAVPAAGLPLADAFRQDTGVEVHASTDRLDIAGSITAGSLSNPRIGDDNHGKQVAGRAAVKPQPGLVLGVSASRAPYVASGAAIAAHATPNQFVQRGLGADVEYSRDHYVVRLESVLSTYQLPTIAPRLRALATTLEGRYKLTPRLHVAARLEHLGFSEVVGAARTTTWDAPVTQWEAGAGYAVQRNTQVRVSFQHHSRDGGRVRKMTALAGQLLYWF
ncbi:MAG: hypothetical protein ABMA15_06015 [Vicinamibacterales bacterium]